MNNEQYKFKINSERVGYIKDIIEFLTDLENAYNCIYAFNFLVDTLRNDNERLRTLEKDRYNRYMKMLYPEIAAYSSQFIFENNPIPTNLLELYNKLDIQRILLPTEKLYITRVNIQSPGFWEVLGSLNPLQQIREYLKDRHERKKDENYRQNQEKELKQLEIFAKQNELISQRIDILAKLGYSEIEIRQLLTTLVIEPLNKLGKHQDTGQIDEPSE